MMKTLVLDVASWEDTASAFSQAWHANRAEENARISFATPELLWRVLTAKRWELLKVMCGAGSLSIREVARRVNRDVKAVHSDITALIKAGVLERNQNGVEFPYETVKVEFMLHAA